VSEQDDYVVNEITDIDHYNGGEMCQYRCGCIAEVVVTGGYSWWGSFFGCVDCLADDGIYPIRDGWIDEWSGREDTI